MPSQLLVTAFMATFGILSAQTASVTGVVSDPHGVVSNAPVQISNRSTGAVARTASKSDGRYAFTGLAAGSYDLTIAMPCCAYNRFSKDLKIGNGENAAFDIRLTETINGTTLGDDPGRLAAAMRRRAKVTNKPAPRTAGGKPDLSGVWVDAGDPYPERPELLPWAAAVAQEREENLGKDAPHNHCLPASPPLPGASVPFIGKIVQTPELLVLLFEDTPGFRQIFLDGRGHPKNSAPTFAPTWMGHSVGKWQGSMLVVDTVGFNDQSWIGGAFPHTAMMHMTERYQRTDYGHMQVHVTFDDPGALAKPLHLNFNWELTPQEELLEYVCENNKPEHLVGK